MTIPSVVADGKVLNTASGTSVTGTFPNSHTATAGRLLLAIHSVANTSAVTTPSGWTLLAGPYTASSNKQINVFGKVSTGGETGVTIAHVTSGRCNVEVFEIQNADGAAIIATPSLLEPLQSTDTQSTATTLPLDAIDPDSTGDMLMVGCICGNTALGTAGTATTWTNSFVNQNDNLASSRQATGLLGGTNLGSTGTTASWSNQGSVTGVLFVINAAAAAAGQARRTINQARTRRAA